MLNKNAKQSIVNYMWREDLKGCTYTRSVTNVFLQLYWNENLMQMFSSEYCEIFKNIYFEEHLQTTASEKTKNQKIKACVCKKSTKI